MSEDSAVPELVWGVSDFVAVLNQTLEYAYPSVTIMGELSNFRVSKNRWVYFDLKDETASVKFFGTVYNLPGPLEDGLMLQVRGQPRLHPLYGFSVNIQSIQPVGEGSLRRAAALLEAKLRAEGLFEPSRKRPLPYPPARIGLVASSESAAYADFIKVLGARWGGLQIELADVQVQGEAAPAQLAAAIEYFNSHATPLDVLVVTRGGGSAEDLAAFNTETVTRAVAASRIPTIVAIGHEVDLNLAELAADQRASTPSNAAELLVPSRLDEIGLLKHQQTQLNQVLTQYVDNLRTELEIYHRTLNDNVERLFERERDQLVSQKRLLNAVNPQRILRQGYAILRRDGRYVGTTTDFQKGQEVDVLLFNYQLRATIESVKVRKASL